MAGAKVFWKTTSKEKTVVAPGVLTRKTSVENGSVEATPGDALPGGEKRAAVCEMPRDAPAAEVDVAAPPAGKKKGVKSAGKALRDKPFKGTSAYKGVAQHRVTRRWESHVWEAKKQLYLGSFAEEVEAARAYDRAAIYLGKPDSELNFSFANYASEAETLRKMTKEQFLAHLRRLSNGFSRGKTRFRGVSYRSQTGRWEARISGVVENKYTYLGTYDRPEDAAMAYDRAAIALKGKDAVTNYDIQNYEKELGHLTKLSQDSLGKNSITTRNAVEASRAAYNKAVEKEKKDAARAQTIKTKAGAEKKKGGRKIVRQANFRAQAPGSRETGQVTRKKRPTKRDRSINSDLRVQQAYAPIAKVVGHGAPVHPQAIPGGWGLGDPYHNPYIPGQSSMYSDQTCAFGFDEGHYGQMGGAQDVSAALEGGYQYNTSSSNKNNILPGMVRPAPELDIPITAFRGDLPAHKGSQGGFPDMPENFLQQTLKEDSGLESLKSTLLFPGEKSEGGSCGQDSIFSDSRALSQENSKDVQANTPRGYSTKSEFDMYVEKLLELDTANVDSPDGNKASTHHEIEENLSAFLNNISLTDIPEIQEGDEEALKREAMIDPAAINFL